MVRWNNGSSPCLCLAVPAYDIPIIPHGSSVYSFHLQYAFKNCPIAECLIMSPKADKIVPYFGSLFTIEPLPKDWYIVLDPNKPGFGVTLNRAVENVCCLYAS